jgi:cytosine/adenosine deaminase-related metal-dependent hydrolase
VTSPAERVLVLEGGCVVTVDGAGSEYADGHVVVVGNRIAAVGAGPAPTTFAAGRRIDAGGQLITPGLVNTHHHLYQWLTRGAAQQSGLFDWLTALYPTWSRLDEESAYAAARAALAVLARSGCTTSVDHHYVFPRDGGDIFGAVIEAAKVVELRFEACRGSMDLGRSQGGLPPDFAVESIDAALAATAAAIDKYHDAAPDALLRVAVAPCSPFSVTPRLLAEAAQLARSSGVRLHTHGAETKAEEAYCRERFGRTPIEHLDDLGWLGPDVWLAHCVHLDDGDISRLAAAATGVAHCPSSNARLGAGTAPVPELLAAGVPVGLGVDGSASNESGELSTELRQALLTSRLRAGPDALTARQALRLGTMGGARLLGREREIGSIEVGKLADLAVWRLDGIAHAGIADPVAGLVLASAPPLSLLLVNGREVVRDGVVRTVDEAEVAGAARAAAARLAGRAAR